MDMIFIHSYLQKNNFIPFSDFKTHISKFFIYFFTKYSSSVFGRANNMIHKNRYIMFFVDVLTHPSNIHKSESRSKLRGINPKRLNTYENYVKQVQEELHTLNQEMIDHLSNGYEVILNQISEEINQGG